MLRKKKLIICVLKKVSILVNTEDTSQRSENDQPLIKNSSHGLTSSKSFYFTLAEDSPHRDFEDSDDSTYDSFHERETGTAILIFFIL